MVSHICKYLSSWIVKNATTFGMDLCGDKQATAQAHVRPHCMRRKNSNSNLKINSKKPRNRSNLFRAEQYARSTHGVHHAIVEINIVIGVVLGELHVVVRVHVPLIVCDDAVIYLTLVLIALNVIVVFVVAIFHRNLLYWKYTVYRKSPPRAALKKVKSSKRHNTKASLSASLTESKEGLASAVSSAAETAKCTFVLHCTMECHYSWLHLEFFQRKVNVWVWFIRETSCWRCNNRGRLFIEISLMSCHSSEKVCSGSPDFDTVLNSNAVSQTCFGDLRAPRQTMHRRRFCGVRKLFFFFRVGPSCAEIEGTVQLVQLEFPDSCLRERSDDGFVWPASLCFRLCTRTLEVCERNVRCGFRQRCWFRQHSSIGKAEASHLIDVTIKSAQIWVVEPPATTAAQHVYVIGKEWRSFFDMSLISKSFQEVITVSKRLRTPFFECRRPKTRWSSGASEAWDVSGWCGRLFLGQGASVLIMEVEGVGQ